MERDTGSIEKTPSAPQKGASLLLVNHTKEIADSQLRTTIMSIDSQPGVAHSTNVGFYAKPSLKEIVQSDIKAHFDDDAKFFLGMLTCPSKDTDTILKRQSVVESLIRYNYLPDCLHYSEKLLMLLGGALSLLEKVRGRDAHGHITARKIRRIEYIFDKCPDIEKMTAATLQTARGSERYQDEDADRKALWNNSILRLGMLFDAAEILPELVAELTMVPNEILQNTLRAINQKMNALHALDFDKMMEAFRTRDKEEMRFLKDTLEDINIYLMHVNLYMKYARFVRMKGLSKLSFDPAQSEQFVQLWNPFVETNKYQVRNPSIAENPAYLVGCNASGKSFYLLENYLAHLQAQAFGYGPMNGNSHVYSDITYMGAQYTDGNHNLSTYGRDIKNWIEYVKRLLRAKPGEKWILLADEPLRHTDSKGQSNVVRGIRKCLEQKGVKVYIATHNRDIIKQADPKSVYHFKTDFNGEGLSYLYSLSQGVAEPSSLYVAMVRDFPRSVLSTVASILTGDEVAKIVPIQKKSKIVAYSVQERMALGSGYFGMLEMVPGYRWFDRVGEMYGNHGRCLLIENSIPRTSSVGVFLTNDDDFAESRGYSFGHTSGNLMTHLKNSCIANTRVLLERQSMFEELMDDEFALSLDLEIENTRFSLDQFTSRGISLETFEGFNGKLYEEAFRDLDCYDHYVHKQHTPRFYGSEFGSKILQNYLGMLDLNMSLLGIDPAELGTQKILDEILGLHTRLKSIHDHTSQKISRIDIKINSRIFTLLNQIHKIVSPHIRAIPLSDGSKWEEIHKISSGVRDTYGVCDSSDRILRQVIFLTGGTSNTGDGLIAKLKSAKSPFLQMTGRRLEEGILGVLGDIDAGIKHLPLLQEFYREKLQDTKGAVADRGRLETWKGHPGLRSRDFDILQGELLGLKDWILLAKFMKEEKFAKVSYNETREIILQGSWNIKSGKEKDKQVKNSFQVRSEEMISLFTGANMSGKTFTLKSLFLALLISQFTGFVPAKKANLPVYNKIIYLDSSRKKDKLSDFERDIESWKEVFKEVDSLGENETAIVIADEPFPGTSEEEQGAFIFAVTKYLAERGVRLIVSSHNHDSVDLIDSQCENVGIYHMKVGKDKNGKIRFQHKITPGHAPSLAIEVAEKLGMPKEIIEMMRGYSDTQSA